MLYTLFSVHVYYIKVLKKFLQDKMSILHEGSKLPIKWVMRKNS